MSVTHLFLSHYLYSSKLIHGLGVRRWCSCSTQATMIDSTYEADQINQGAVRAKVDRKVIKKVQGNSWNNVDAGAWRSIHPNLDVDFEIEHSNVL